MLTVEKPEHNFISFSFSFKNTFVVVVGLPRQTDSDHLVILKHKLFTGRFVPFSLRCRSLLFNIPKFMFSLFIKKVIGKVLQFNKITNLFSFFI